MKKAIFILVMIGFTSGTFLLSCQSSAEKEEEAQENLQEAQEELIEAEQDANTEEQKVATEEEFQVFKDKINSKIDANETQIAELKAKIKKTGKSLDSLHSKNINGLEIRNKDLKMRISGYKNDSKKDWESFKRELDYDVNKLDQAVKDITAKIKNKN